MHIFALETLSTALPTGPTPGARHTEEPPDWRAKASSLGIVKNWRVFMFKSVSPNSTSPCSGRRGAPLLEIAPHFENPPEQRKNRLNMSSMKAPNRQRQARRAPRPGAGLQRYLPALQGDARPPCHPARRLGYPRAAGGNRRRESSSALPARARSKPTASPSSTSCAGSRLSNTSRNGNRFTDRLGFWVDLKTRMSPTRTNISSRSGGF
jgi:hypothetical protein